MAIKVSLGFARLVDRELDNFAQSVISHLTGNATYPTPPVTLADLQTATDDYIEKLNAAAGGAFQDIADKNNSRQVLLGKLRQTASYVQIRCNDDLALLLSSGFNAQSTNRASIPLAKPQELGIKTSETGTLVASVRPVKNTSLYEGRIKGPTGDWLPSVFSGDSQHIRFTGLTPGTNYTIQVRALGGSTGQSDWSDPSSHMSM